MDSEPINVQKLLYIMRLASCLNQKLPIDFADEAKNENSVSFIMKENFRPFKPKVDKVYWLNQKIPEGITSNYQSQGFCRLYLDVLPVERSIDNPNKNKALVRWTIAANMLNDQRVSIDGKVRSENFKLCYREEDASAINVSGHLWYTTSSDQSGNVQMGVALQQPPPENMLLNLYL